MPIFPPLIYISLLQVPVLSAEEEMVRNRATVQLQQRRHAWEMNSVHVIVVASRKHIRDTQAQWIRSVGETNCNKYYSGCLIYYLRHWGKYQISSLNAAAIPIKHIAVIEESNEDDDHLSLNASCGCCCCCSECAYIRT